MANQIPGGYHGKVLRVNLTESRITTEEIYVAFCRRYIGGTSF